MARIIKMRALQSRTASQSPTGKPLKPGAEYDADATTADAEERRGLAERVQPVKPAAASKGGSAG